MNLAYAPTDYDGLAAALQGFFEDALKVPGPPRPPLSLAHEMWITRLSELDELLSVDSAAARDLDEADVRGLALYRRERQKVLSQHESCGKCGSVYRRGGFCPRGCRG